MSTTETPKQLERLNLEDLRLLARFLAQHLRPRGSYLTTLARFSQIVTDGSGNGVDSLVGPIAGSYWLVQRISIHASAGTPSLGVFVGPFKNTDPSNRRDFASAGLSSDQISDETNPIYVGPGEWLTFQWAGATAAASVTAACQIEVHKLAEGN